LNVDFPSRITGMFSAGKNVCGLCLGEQRRGNHLQFETRVFRYGRMLLGAAFAAIGVGSGDVFAHQAPTGWTYPWACCHDMDCREVKATSIREGPKGYVIRSTGEVIPMTDSRIKNSPDGEYHWCSVAGRDNTRTICLFVPPRDS
jgi:hypothetical protein